ncbi:MAG: TetR/AcrR family transcriptional regulator [Candidatus Kapabacteria bacterium]|nr:TetR/AcrR family transcriptional regulator [Candidatus Kapabacteria bacterium]
MTTLPDIEPHTRDRILATAEQHFTTELYSTVSTDALAQELGISKKTLYKHFRSKEEILREVLQRISERISNALQSIFCDEGCPFIQKVSSYLNYMTEVHRNMTPRSILLDVQKNAPHAWSVLAEHNMMRMKEIEEFLMLGINEGKIHASIQLDIVTLIYMRTIMHIMDARSLNQTSIPTSEQYSIFTELFYSGILSDKARAVQVSELAKLEMRKQMLLRQQSAATAPADDDSRNRLRIIHTSMGLFFQFGFSRVSMDEIAQNLGMSKKTLYKHYESKSDILRGVFEHISNHARQAQGVMDYSNVESFVISINGFFSYMSTILSSMSQQFACDLMKSEPEIWNTMNEWRNQEIDAMFTELMQRGAAIGAVRNDIPPNSLAQVYRVVIDSVMNPTTISGNPHHISEIYLNIASTMFYGILSAEGRSEFNALRAGVYEMGT